MNNLEKIYTGLCIIFSVLLVVGNLTYQKFAIISFVGLYRFELSVGAILYPMTFLITDLITEFYGKEKAVFCVRFAMFVNLLVAIIISCMDALPTAAWSKIDGTTFHKVFSLYYVALTSSLIACYIAQKLDITLYLLLRKITKGKYLWLRNNVSTAISLFIDTFIVITVMTMFNILPKEQKHTLIINSYSWKLAFTILSTPMFYLSFAIIKSLIKQDDKQRKF